LNKRLSNNWGQTVKEILYFIIYNLDEEKFPKDLSTKLLINVSISNLKKMSASAQSDQDHAVCLPTLLQVEKLIANSMDPDQTARMRRLVWIHAGRKRSVGFVLTRLKLTLYPLCGPCHFG
jgi:hypothetical protein